MNIIGIGIDATDLPRVADLVERYGDRFLRRVFTDGEIAYCTKRRNPVPHLAGRFADRLVLMDGGSIAAEGEPEAMLGSTRLGVFLSGAGALFSPAAAAAAGAAGPAPASMPRRTASSSLTSSHPRVAPTG